MERYYDFSSGRLQEVSGKDSEKWAHLYDEVDFQIISHVAFRAYCAGVTDMADEAIESMGGIVNAPR